MKELLYYLVSSLVDEPEEIVIRESVGQKNIAYMVTLPPEDIGKVIGKGGRIAYAMRIIMRAAGGLHDKVVWVDFGRQGSR